MKRGGVDAGPSDDDLVAYLDGELSPAESVRIGQRLAADPALAARLQHLANGARPFADALAPLLAEAPVERLEAMLDAARAKVPAAPRRTGVWRGSPGAWAAALACLLAGAAVDRIVLAPVERRMAASAASEDDDWRRAVAQYLSLYTRETLAALPDDRAGDRLTTLGNGIGLTLDAAQVDLPGASLKRADLYDYDGRALAFLAYLDPGAGPVALCITEGQGGTDAQRIEARRGMTVVYWSQGRHRFMLIGHAPAEKLQTYAAMVAARFDRTEHPRG